MLKKLSAFLISSVLTLTVLGCAIACGCGCSNHNAPTTSSEVDHKGKVQCPVMKTWINPSEAADSVEYHGTTYYFCCEGCKPKFLDNPEKYISELADKT